MHSCHWQVRDGMRSRERPKRRWRDDIHNRVQTFRATINFLMKNFSFFVVVVEKIKVVLSISVFLLAHKCYLSDSDEILTITMYGFKGDFFSSDFVHFQDFK